MQAPAPFQGARLVLGAALVTVILAGCDAGAPAPSAAARPAPGSLLEPVAAHAQPRGPLDSLVAHLDGFHFRNGDLASQQRVQQYCGTVADDVVQCALFDGDKPGARLTGVKYVIGERRFEQLPDDEKPYWHSQVHQVKSGTLVAPGLPDDADRALAQRLVKTYAKTWQFWPTDRKAELPVGVPQLMMGFTRDGQLDPVLLSERDRSIGVASAEVKRRRADVPEAPPAAGADAWQQGRVAQVQGAVAERRQTP